MKRLPKNLVVAVGVAVLLIGVLFVAAYAMPAPAPLEVDVPQQGAVTTTVAAKTMDMTATEKSPVVPFLTEWQKSGHSDITAEAFKHWPTATEKEVPVACAKCHSSEGYRDFLGVDGSKAGVVDKAVPLGSLIDCVACHNAGTVNKTSVTFPSGITLKNLGSEARCMECHQGRESTVSVNNVISDTFKLKDADEDTVVKPLITTDASGKTVTTTFGFRNVHYYPAAATQYGTQAKGGYEYKGQLYDGKFQHPEPYDTCVGCHNSHSLELEIKECATCHTGVTKPEDFAKIRMAGSLMDYDGDGNAKEGIGEELTGLQEKLFAAIQAYAKEVSKADIGYDLSTYPYFFADKNADGKLSTGEGPYAAWTPRLLKAAYNYQIAAKDPGKLAHNAKYVIQLMYDSIKDLNTKLAKPVDIAKAERNDAGHFDGTAMAFRDWDAEGAVPANCAKCHSADGLPEFLESNGTVAVTSSGSVVTTGVSEQHPANGFACTTCHNDLTKYTLHPVVNVPFPSGKSLTFSKEKDEKGALKPVAANLCLECHQGRQSKSTIDLRVKGVEDDKIDTKITFANPHYFAAGATLFGDAAQVGYQYDGKKYVGQNAHAPGFATCTECHSTHELGVKMDKCVTCHAGVKTPQDIRISAKDYDGDKDVKEGIAAEITALES
ncbi:MAG: cytochrome c3 family protein, partial [Anaerolineae bacterium]|nr:cytochrome c3 family protein [Anaerolineae bacterium]